MSTYLKDAVFIDEIKVDLQGRVQLPKKFREKTGIEAGDMLTVRLVTLPGEAKGRFFVVLTKEMAAEKSSQGRLNGPSVV